MSRHRERGLPCGVTSLIHLDDAAGATVLALEHEGPAIYNIADDEPAPVREWELRYPSWRQGFVAAYGSVSHETRPVAHGAKPGPMVT